MSTYKITSEYLEWAGTRVLYVTLTDEGGQELTESFEVRGYTIDEISEVIIDMSEGEFFDLDWEGFHATLEEEWMQAWEQEVA